MKSWRKCKFAYQNNDSTQVMCRNIEIIKTTLRLGCRHPKRPHKCVCFQRRKRCLKLVKKLGDCAKNVIADLFS